MNLEALVDKLHDSQNRVFADKIFAQMDLIDEARKQWIKKKESHKIECEKACLPLITQREQYKALNTGFSKDYKENIKSHKQKTKAKLKELTSDYKIEVKQLKSEINKFGERLDSYYKHHKKEYEKAIHQNVENAKQKFENFEKDFKEFRIEEIKNITNRNLDKVNELTEAYNAQVNLLKKELHDYISNELITHKKQKNEKYVKSNKAKIKEISAQIKVLKKASFQAKNDNKPEIVKTRENYEKVKKEANVQIKQIKLEKAQYAKTLTGNDLVLFNNLEKLIRQEFISRRKIQLTETFKKKTAKINPAYLFVAPAFLGALVMTIFPFCFMLISAWFKLDLVNLENSEFRGFRNFILIFTQDTEFQQSLTNTAIYALVTFGLLTVVTIGMAAWLAKNTKIHNTVQTMVFTPHIASLVSISIVWIALLNPDGIINQLLAVFGIEGPGWLIQENTSLISVSFVQVWKDIGYYVLIIISGLQGIPSYVYEAAKLDKASRPTTFFKITLPLLTPTLSFVFVTKFINSFKVFAPIEIMTNGGPMGSSMVLSYWIYKVGRVGYNYGMAMAGAIVLTIIVGGFTIFNYRFFANKSKK